MDGVLIEGEEVWDAVREQLVRERGGRWTSGAQAAMMGMSSPEWSRYMAAELGVPMEPAAISSETVAGVAARYAEGLPLVNGAVEVVRELAGQWPLGLASSANRPIIELAAGSGGVDRLLETAEPDAALSQPGDGVDQMPQGPAEPVEFPDDQGVAGAELVQELREDRPVAAGAAGGLGEHPIATGTLQGVDLELGMLVGGGDAGIAEQVPRRNLDAGLAEERLRRSDLARISSYFRTL
jgi:hypothetical protein